MIYSESERIVSTVLFLREFIIKITYYIMILLRHRGGSLVKCNIHSLKQLYLPQDRIPPNPQRAKYLEEPNSQELPGTTAAAAMPA